MGKKKEVVEAVETNETDETVALAVETFTLKSICEELGMNPAAARRKLRSKFSKAEGDFRWEFDADGKAEVVAILTAKPEPKAKAKAKAEAEAEETAEA